MGEPAASLLVIGCYGILRGIDLSTGATVWEHKLDEYRGAVAFAIVDDAIYAATEFSGLLCVGYGDGQVRWQRPLGEVNDRPSMLVTPDVLLVYKGGQVFCFGYDGSLRWTTEAESTPTMGVPGEVVPAPAAD